MPESDELLRALKQIEGVQGYHSHLLELLLKVQDHDALRAEILPFLKRPHVFAVYQAVDGARSGVDIAEYTGIPQPTVSPYLQRLERLGLIHLIDITTSAKTKTPMFALLNLARHLPNELVEQYVVKRRRARRKSS
jgi:predicted transcriptional regulator